MPFDDTSSTDEWQKEVYQCAAALMESENLSTVYDIGFRSGYKLVNYLRKFDSVGFDLPDTVMFLRLTYADHKWREADFDDRSIDRADLVLCADVIEHLPDPDQLLRFIAAVAGKYIIFSTPDRDLVSPKGSRGYYGPPRNRSHCREWTFVEFERYIAQAFNILDHRISNRCQATQMILCTPK